MSLPSLDDEPPSAATSSLRTAIPNTTAGNAWRHFIASIAFETKADLSLIRDLEEQDQARFLVIVRAFMPREMSPTRTTQARPCDRLLEETLTPCAGLNPY